MQLLPSSTGHGLGDTVEASRAAVLSACAPCDDVGYALQWLIKQFIRQFGDQAGSCDVKNDA
jgi:hypothetical protein